ncbi:Choline dehydrogenase [Tetrabaena socialis]|uniref:Choline dehydrogenase n=1 Tax=Tetrabaena socialis TaxID=47790 RepID=A0A2J7ZZU0_9CHLO|nr:Choline dehydrogenase [Tetrabaena socialis]|eukprot:PNH05783.1 Choline dehydrogenase [Tetrabaena socialis]
MNETARKGVVEVDGTLRIVPRRYWFLPYSWFLPSAVPLEGTVTMHIKSWNDKVARVQERFFNIPTIIPVPVRWLVGWAVGTAGVLSEPALAQLYDWYSAGYSGVQGGVEQALQSAPVAAAVEKAEGLRGSVAEGVQAAKAKVLEGETFPGVRASSDKDIDEYVRRTVHSGNALVGTCAMGASAAAGAVVSSADLKVFGVAGLRVVDASVIPTLPGGQTGAATVMVAERAAALLLGKAAIASARQQPVAV